LLYVLSKLVRAKLLVVESKEEEKERFEVEYASNRLVFIESIKVCVYDSISSVDSVVVGLVEGLSLQRVLNRLN
jgi:hypothetical protein